MKYPVYKMGIQWHENYTIYFNLIISIWHLGFVFCFFFELVCLWTCRHGEEEIDDEKERTCDHILSELTGDTHTETQSVCKC